MIAGMKNRKHNKTLIRRSLPTPFFIKTAIGGKKIERMISTILFIVSPVGPLAVVSNTFDYSF